MTDEIARRDSDPSVAVMLQNAIEKGLNVESLEKLMALHERHEANQARKAFAEAFADFQRECPVVQHSRTASFVSKKGAKIKYSYAEIDKIAATVVPFLSKHGLSYSWDSSFSPDGKLLTAICTLRHKDGHAQMATFACPVEENDMRSGAQNAKAALTFAQRVALIQVLGLTTAESDVDGEQGAAEGTYSYIKPEQIGELERVIASAGADMTRFLAWIGAPRLDDIRAADYDKAMQALAAKAKK